MKKRSFLFFLAAALLLSGCGGTGPVSATVPAETAVTTEATEPVPTETIDASLEAQALSQAPEPATAVILEAVPSGTDVARCDTAEVDYSNSQDGYIMVRYTGTTEQRLKVLLKGPTTTYNYNLPVGQWTVFPLSDGSGSYQAGIYINVGGSRYATVLTANFTAQLQDEFAPFLRPNQYVEYTCAPQTVAKGLEVTAGIEDPLLKVAAVYDFVVTHLQYDHEKAQSVQSGYLPQLDQILAYGKGICFDYAAMMTAMLRSQEIPCKLVVGYAGTVYHAWISVWTEESGWIDGAIFFDGHVWHRMDPTFASSSSRSEEIMEFIEHGNYTVKYLY